MPEWARPERVLPFPERKHVQVARERLPQVERRRVRLSLEVQKPSLLANR